MNIGREKNIPIKDQLRISLAMQQSMVFVSKDIGPIGCSQNEQQSSKYDKDTVKTKKVKYQMFKLAKMLKNEKNAVTKGNLKKIQKIVTDNNIPLYH